VLVYLRLGTMPIFFTQFPYSRYESQYSFFSSMPLTA
jgi:hypothetical protein